MALANGIIIRVVTGCDLERSRAEFACHILIRNDRDFPSQHRHDHFLADVFPVALVFGVDSHGGIGQDRLRPGGGHRDILGL